MAVKLTHSCAPLQHNNPAVTVTLKLIQSCICLQNDNPEVSGDSMDPLARPMEQVTAAQPTRSFSASERQLQVAVPAGVEGEDDDVVSSPREAAAAPVSHLPLILIRGGLRQGWLGCCVVRQQEGAMSSCGQTDAWTARLTEGTAEACEGVPGLPQMLLLSRVTLR